ncbi:MAG: hypothetical protein ACLFWD_04075 [Anaerolineales bacterium]
MPPIRCHYADCLNLEEGFCAADSIELDPEDGCLTYDPLGVSPEEDWDEDEPYDGFWEEEDDLYEEEEEEVDWLGGEVG